MKRNYTGEPVAARETLQRLCTRYKRESKPELVSGLLSLTSQHLTPEREKRLPGFIKKEDVTCLFEGDDGVLWLGTNEGLWRVNERESEELDRIQCFRASAYMLDNNVVAVDGDGDNGVFVLTQTGVSHIGMKQMTLKEKAELLSEFDFRHGQRRGMLSGTEYDSKSKCWHARESDNDGLWTALVAMGDICRYAVLRDDKKTPPKELAHAREIAIRWTEAVLLLAYIPGRRGKAPAFVRYNAEGTNEASKRFLLDGGKGELLTPDKGPAGCVMSPSSPAYPEDWALPGEGIPQIVFKNIEGFIARSYHVNDPVNDPVPHNDGVFFKKVRTPDGGMISVRLPGESDKGDDMAPLLSVDSSMPVPERLRKLYTSEISSVTGKHFDDDDIIYKADTSNDELVGHYAVWQLAYDVFKGDDDELCELIKNAVSLHARHMTDNRHALTDAGGQPTSWARMTREYYMNRSFESFADAPLGTLILMQLYKVAYHITGEKEWDCEYRKLALDEPYRYADLASEHYDRYAIIAKDLVDDEDNEDEIFNFIVKHMNYSDVRMAAIAYYTLFQLEDDETLLKKFRAGADSWWRLEKYARDVEWLLVYQLAYNTAPVTDGHGRNCGEMLRWQLSRFPLSCRQFEIDNTTRPDVREDEGFLFFPDSETPCAVAMDERGAVGADFFEAVQGRDGRREVAGGYNMIFPYWVARYNGLLREDGKGGSVTFDDLMDVLEHDFE